MYLVEVMWTYSVIIFYVRKSSNRMARLGQCLRNIGGENCMMKVLSFLTMTSYRAVMMIRGMFIGSKSVLLTYVYRYTPP